MNVDNLRERIAGAFRSVFAPQQAGEMNPPAPVDDSGVEVHVVDTSDVADALMPLSEARAIVRDPSRHVSSKTNFVAMVLASHVICESGEATLDDLLACASAPFSSATWRPTHLLHERLDVPKCFDGSGFIIRDPDFWRERLLRLAPMNSDTQPP